MNNLFVYKITILNIQYLNRIKNIENIIEVFILIDIIKKMNF